MKYTTTSPQLQVLHQTSQRKPIFPNLRFFPSISQTWRPRPLPPFGILETWQTGEFRRCDHHHRSCPLQRQQRLQLPFRTWRLSCHIFLRIWQRSGTANYEVEALQPLPRCLPASAVSTPLPQLSLLHHIFHHIWLPLEIALFSPPRERRF